MCGRFTYRLTWPEIVRLYQLPLDIPPRNPRPRYNICPTTTIDVVVGREGERELVPMRWGLVPAWWPKPLRSIKDTFNARAESVAEMAMFRSAFARSRCLIPATGYYEWRDAYGSKQPYYFTRADGDPVTIAGLWDEWKDGTTGERIKSCTMITTEANKLVADVHDRMPVILEQEDFEPWLAGTANEPMKPAANDVLLRWPVSKRVNSPRARDDDPTLIDCIEMESVAAS